MIGFSMGLWNSTDSESPIDKPIMPHCGNSPKSTVEKQIILSLSELFQSTKEKQGLWNYSDSVPLFVFLLEFGTVATLYHYSFYMGLWNCSDSVAVFVCI
jgi:hypothetical protein